MIVMGIDKSFLGTGWSFPPVFDKYSGDVKMVTEEEDIKESLFILLSTAPGERIMEPDYGCGIQTMVFENMTTNIITELQDIIERAILFFESRITLDSIEIDTKEQYDGLLKILLNYTV